jgi:hypothetical protein
MRGCILITDYIPTYAGTVSTLLKHYIEFVSINKFTLFMISEKFSIPENFVLIQGQWSGDQWTYRDNTPLRYANWGEGEKDKTSENIRYIALSVTNFSWYSKDSVSKFPFICEVSPPEYLIVP